MKDFIENRNWVGHALEGRTLQTPAFYYAPGVIAEDMAAIRASIGGQVVMSLTACPLQEMLSRLPEAARFGVVTSSRSEMNMVAAWDSDHAYVHLPGLDSQLGRAILGMGHRLIAESPAQIQMMADLRGRRQLKPILLSINPALVMEGAVVHRGMQARALKEAVQVAKECGVEIDGLSLAWQGRFDSARALEALRGMRGLMQETAAIMGAPVTRLLMGEWTDVLTCAQDTSAYRAAVQSGPKGEVIAHQGSSSIFQRCGVLVTKVTDSQASFGQQRAVCDASILSAQMAVQSPTGRMAEIRRLGADDSPDTRQDEGETMLVGATGLEGDVFGQLPFAARPGDLLAFENMGAHVRTLSPSGAMGGQPAPALLFDTDQTEAKGTQNA